MSSDEWGEHPFELGSDVCIIGYGVSNQVHKHVKVERYTKTQIVAGKWYKFQRAEPHRSIPYEDYSGYHIKTAADCPKAKAKQPWTMPEWMKPYEEFIANSDGHDIAKLVNDWRNAVTFKQLKRTRPDYYNAALQVASQLILLERLHKAGKLP